MTYQLVYDLSDAQHDFVRAVANLQAELRHLDDIMARAAALGAELRATMEALERAAKDQADRLKS